MTSRADIGELKSVLIVEDHSLLRRVMRDLLQSAFPGCSFREATDGARAYVCKDRVVTSLVPAVAAAIGVPPATDTGAS